METYPPETTNVRPSILIVRRLLCSLLEGQVNTVSITARGTSSNIGEPENMPRHLLIDNDALLEPPNGQTYRKVVMSKSKSMD